jgi:hypothetical protein
VIADTPRGSPLILGLFLEKQTVFKAAGRHHYLAHTVGQVVPGNCGTNSFCGPPISATSAVPQPQEEAEQCPDVRGPTGLRGNRSPPVSDDAITALPRVLTTAADVMGAVTMTHSEHHAFSAALVQADGDTRWVPLSMGSAGGAGANPLQTAMTCLAAM